MKKRYAIFLAIMISALIYFNYSFISSHSNPRVTAIVSRVIDGDTLVLDNNVHIRLLNINAPEKTEINANQSAIFLKQFVGKQIQLEETGQDKYQRTLARLYAPDYLNFELVSLGLVKKFLVSSSELGDFANAEKNAISQGLGIWQHSQYFGCFKSSVDSKAERVTLTNTCSELSLKGWELKDESRKTYTFKDINALNNQNIMIFSGKGQDDKNKLYWNSDTNIWNDDRDTLYLLDEKGKIVHSQTYGY